MKTLILMSILLIAGLAQAEKISCNFTEPFIRTTYNPSNSTLTYEEFAEGLLRVVEDVESVALGEGQFQLVDKTDGTVLQVLTLNHKGSDGMSDVVYPYEVKDNSDLLEGNRGIGGCFSDSLPGTVQ